MALPFIAGIAVGAGVVYALSKSDRLKEKANSIFNKSKDVACNSIEKSKETVDDVKDTINATAACIKEKKEKIALEKEEALKIEEKSKEN